MASIFLSYARDDAAKAKALARCLERAGHSVWWDRHIQGGSEYADEIEAALTAADVIVVLWSDKASHSAWVRDEAAEGRDSGRLVPLLLDSSPAPLGFRQLQSISIAGWSGRGNPPEFAAIKAAIERVAGKPVAQGSSEPKSPPRRRLVAAGIAALALLLAAAAGWLVLRPGAAAAEPTIAVLPFADLSPARDKTFLAEGVAESILTALAREPGIKVIGRSSASQLQQAGAGAGEMRKALGITHVLEGSARSIGDQLRMSVRLIDAKDGSQLWAEEYQRRIDNIFAVQDEISRAVARKLSGSLASATRQSSPTSANVDAYTLYLAARARMRERHIGAIEEAAKLARRAIAADPNYAPAHAVLAELISLQSYDNYGTISPERAEAMALPHARRAIELAPNAPEGHAALGMVYNGPKAIAPLERAIALDPARAELRLWLSNPLHSLGRHEEALRQVEQAVAMDPLFTPAVRNLAHVLDNSGRTNEAEAVLRQFVERGGSKALAAKVRGDMAGSRGDLSEAIRLNRQALAADPNIAQARMSLAWNYYALGMHRAAADMSQELPPYSRLYVAGDNAELARAIANDGPGLWSRPDFDVAIEALAVARDWPTIASLYRARPSVRDKVCISNNGWMLQLGLHLAIALREAGQAAEAQPLIECVKRQLAIAGKGPIRQPFLSGSSLAGLQAQVAALEGRPAEGLRQFALAVERGLRSPLGTGLDQGPAFDAARSTPEYRRLDARLKQLVAAERAETLRLAAKPA